MISVVWKSTSEWSETKQIYVVSQICPYRPIKGVRGFSRETVVALLTNIENQEYIRRQYSEQNEMPEHPRASSTDDVECFFSILHNQLGLNYNLKAIQNRWRVICNEFTKRIDTDLPFHYYTSEKNRYKIPDMPSFDKPTASGPARFDFLRLPRREDVGHIVVGRTTMPVRGTRTVRQQFHSNPASLPQLHGHHSF